MISGTLPMIVVISGYAGAAAKLAHYGFMATNMLWIWLHKSLIFED